MAIFDLKRWYSGIFNSEFLNWAASFGSGYGRRMAEPHYDRIAETDFFKKLKQQDKPVKYLLEAVNNAITALIDQKIDDATPLRKLLKEVFMDSSSELNKRLLNGESSQKIMAEKSGSLDTAERNYLAALLMLEETKMDILLKWILALDDRERAETMHSLRNLNPEELEKLANLSPEARNRLFQTLKKPEEEKTESEIYKSMKSARGQLNQWLTERLERKRRERNGRNIKTDIG
jgi:hypothetical protein